MLEKLKADYDAGKTIIIECIDFDIRRKLHSFCDKEGLLHRSFICDLFPKTKQMYFLSYCCKKMVRVTKYTYGFMENNADGTYYGTCPKCKEDLNIDEIDCTDRKIAFITNKNAIKIGKLVSPIGGVRDKTIIEYTFDEIDKYLKTPEKYIVVS